MKFEFDSIRFEIDGNVDNNDNKTKMDYNNHFEKQNKKT